MLKAIVVQASTMFLVFGLPFSAIVGCSGSTLTPSLTGGDAADGPAAGDARFTSNSVEVPADQGVGRSGGDAAVGVTGGRDGSTGLNGNVSPGGNFDLSLWELQEPIGSPGAPTMIPNTALEGPSGFQDAYFFTDPTDGAMTFWDPESGVATANSNYPRSELRELNADGSKANWQIAGTNTLSASIAVTQVPDHVCIGQIHVGTAIQSGLAPSTKPLVELYYYQNGDIKVGIEDSPTGGQTSHELGNVPLGSVFSYTIQLTGDGTIAVVVNDAAYTFMMPSSFVGYGQYFKAGDYDQTFGTDSTVGATVKFFALKVLHNP